MGNQASVPEPFTENVDRRPEYSRITQNVNQARMIGNPDPPQQRAETLELLSAASPRGFNLAQATAADNSEILRQAEACRSREKGLQGLRKLRDEVGDRTALEPGCGWMYEPGGTDLGKPVLGTVEKTATGFTERPLLDKSGQPDYSAGKTFRMDLERAEVEISQKISNQYPSCASIGGSDPRVRSEIGWCKTSNKTIPIVRNSNGTIMARFPENKEFRCAPGDIILPENAQTQCGAQGTRSGFRNPTSVEVAGSAYRSGGSNQAIFGQAFKTPSWAAQNQYGTPTRRAIEGFIDDPTKSDTDAQRCVNLEVVGTSAEGKHCIRLAALRVGFRAEGAFLKYLNTTSSVEPPIFDVYKKLLENQNITTEFIPSQLSSKGFAHIVDILNEVRNDMDNADSKIAGAAKDIVTSDGFYVSNFNECDWMATTARDRDAITAENLVCLQNYWRNGNGVTNMGASRGTKYPVLEDWVGKTIGEFKAMTDGVSSNERNTDPDAQATAMAEKYGINSYQETINTTGVAPPQNCIQQPSNNTKETDCQPGYRFPGAPDKQYKQYYAVTKPRLAGGDACKFPEPPSYELKNCELPVLAPIDCESEWVIKEKCDTTCGVGKEIWEWRVKTAPNATGKQCNPPAKLTEERPCKARECRADDCKYTITTTGSCPDATDVSRCGVQVTKTITYNLDPSNNPNAANFCPTPNPQIENCPIIPCPPIQPATVEPCEIIVYYEKNYRSAFVRLKIGRRGAQFGDFTNDAIQSIRVGSGVTATLYEHFDAGGQRYTITGDMPDLGGFWNKNVSTIDIAFKPDGPCAPIVPKVPSCEVWLFYEFNYGTRQGYPPYTVLKVGNWDWNDWFNKRGNRMDIDTYSRASCDQLGGIYHANGECTKPQGGSFSYVPPGTPNKNPWDDQVRSIRLGSGVRAIIYADPNFTGRSAILTQDSPNIYKNLGTPYFSFWGMQTNGISAIKVEPNGQVATCIPIAPPAGCSSRREYLGTFTLSSGSRAPNSGEIMMMINPTNPQWNTVAGAIGEFASIKFMNSHDNSNAGQILDSQGKARGIPLDGLGFNGANGGGGTSDTLTALAGPGRPDRDFTRAIPMRPFIMKNGKLINGRWDWDTGIYGGETFCIILESETNPNSSITLTRMGRPRMLRGYYEFQPFIAKLNGGLPPMQGEWGVGRNWNSGLTGMWPFPDSSVGVSSGTPILGGRYKMYYSIRSSDIPEAIRKGFNVMQ